MERQPTLTRVLAGPAWRPAAVLFVTVVLCYATGLGNGFLWIDHSEIVQGTMRVTSWSEVPEIFLRANNAAGYHRPVYQLVLTLDHAIWGSNALGYYLSSLLIHAVNVALLLVLLRRCGANPLAAFVIAALWGLHPANSAVAGLIHAKADLVGLSCALVCLLASERLRGPSEQRAWPWAVGLFAFVVGVLTKELLFLLPVVLAIYALRPGARRLRPFVIVLGVVALALGGLHVFATSGAETRPAELGLGERLLTFTTVYLDYFRLLILPWSLSMSDAVTRFDALSTPVQCAALLGCSLVLGGQAYAAWRFASLRGWLLLFHLALAPVAQLVPILHFRADRYLYVPSLVWIGGLVQAFVLIRSNPNASLGTRTLVATVAAVCVLFAVRIGVRLQDFRDDITLFTKEVAHTPDYREGLTHLGRAHEQQGRFAVAARCYRAALLPNPDRVSYVNRDALVVNLTRSLAASGEMEQAYTLATRYESSVRSPAHRSEVTYNRAIAAYNLGRFRVALDLLQRYAETHPDDAVCVFLVGAAAKELGETETARLALRRYLDLGHPDAKRNARARRMLESL